jgi:hypothetical protein
MTHRRPLTTLLAALAAALIAGASLTGLGAAPAAATPTAVAPANGATISYTAQKFSWTDDQSQGPLYDSYLEISTSPTTDYVDYGYFAGNVVYASPDLPPATRSLDLGSLGRALAPGTYYWHVLAKYGQWYGNLGTYWTPVRSFVVANTVAAPAIGVSPASLEFTVPVNSTSWTEASQQVALTNLGSGTLTITATPSGVTWLSDLAGANTGTIQFLRVAVSPNPSGSLGGRGAVGIGTYTSYIRMSAPSTATRDLAVTMHVVAIDSTAPTPGTMVGPAWTSSAVVTLHPSATDAGSGVTAMALSQDGGPWGAWMPYATTLTWDVGNGPEGTHLVYVRYRDAAGNISTTTSAAVKVDRTAPTVPTLGGPALALGTTATLPVSWTAATDRGAGLAFYHLQIRTLPTGTWVDWGPGCSCTSAAVAATPGATYQLRVRAYDQVGNRSNPSAALTAHVPFDQSSATVAAGRWSTLSRAGAYRGTVRVSTGRGASLALRASARVLGLLVTQGRGHGKLAVYVDGVLRTTFDSYRSSTVVRHYVPVRTYTSAGTHTITVVNLATPGRPTVEVDAIIASR